MDKLSAVLAVLIVAMMVICAALIYRINLGNDDMEYEVLVFNEDTSVTNSSEDDLWIRVKAEENQSAYLIDSMKSYIDDEAWVDGGDGWHYYKSSLSPKKQSEPFIDEEWFLIDKGDVEVETIKLQVEGMKK